MPLTAANVQKAQEILCAINPTANNSVVDQFNPDDLYEENKVLGSGPLPNNEWRCVYLNVKNITPEQLATFENRCNELKLNTLNKTLPNGITQLGWY